MFVRIASHGNRYGRRATVTSLRVAELMTSKPWLAAGSLGVRRFLSTGKHGEIGCAACESMLQLREVCGATVRRGRGRNREVPALSISRHEKYQSKSGEFIYGVQPVALALKVQRRSPISR